MATFTKAITKDLFDKILPTFGNSRVNIPTWDNSQKMFIFNEYESANGHRYYKGVRFCDRVVIVEKVGLFHNWTYIDGIELYAFDNMNLRLIQKRDYDKVFRKEEFVRQETLTMLQDYLSGIAKTNKAYIPIKEIDALSKSLIDRCYKSFLDHDFNMHLAQIIPAITRK